MKELIDSVLSEIDIDFYYLKRPQNVFPCIVYYYNETTNSLGDNKEESSKYNIYINLFIKSDISNNINKVKKKLEEYGFIKKVINSPIQFDGLDYYQVTFNYTKIIAA